MFKGIGQQKDTLLITEALIHRRVSFFSPKNLESLLVTSFQFSYRACFKILPKILCFNTMRYTFNMVTMMKEKVNTHFSFPMKLNMAPYAEEYLMQNKDQGTIVCCWLKIHFAIRADFVFIFYFISNTPNACSAVYQSRNLF